jgi:hypothetical protein
MVKNHKMAKKIVPGIKYPVLVVAVPTIGIPGREGLEAGGDSLLLLLPPLASS